MQWERYSNPEMRQEHCVWCYQGYYVAASHAGEESLFCSKRCEVEARFWLLDQLKAPPSARSSPAEGI